MIQIIRYSNYINCSKFTAPYVTKTFDVFDSFDEYEVCVIDLSNSELWHNDGISVLNVNSTIHLKHFKKIISNSKTAKILIVLPQNVAFLYNKLYGEKYGSSLHLKNSLETIYNIMSNNLLDFSKIQISFEPTKCNIRDKSYNADFYFSSYPETCEKITESYAGKKVSTIRIDNNIAITTLDVTSNQEFLSDFLMKTGFVNQSTSEIPEWLNNINFLDDEQLISTKNNCIANINILKDEISKIDSKLADNNEYKKILYGYGEELAKQVMRILDEILDNDSSDFVDNCEEDFLIKKDNITFVGEIKGVSSNVNNDLVGAPERHLQEYNDKLDVNGITENTKGIFIINHQRQKDLCARIPVDEKQIKLAEKYGILMVETTTLLKIFEDFINEKIKTAECIDIFSSNIGLLSYKSRR